MKTRNLKNIGWMTLTAALLTVGQAHAQAQDPFAQGTQNRINQAPTHRSYGYNPQSEGTETRLDPQSSAKYQNYRRSSEASLRDLITDANRLSDRQAKGYLRDKFEAIVVNSAPQMPETLMRHILNRAEKTVGQIDRFSDNSLPGVLDQEVRVYKESAKIALEYSENEVTYLQSIATAGVTPLPYADFGTRYVKFIMQMNDSLLGPKAMYAIANDALGGWMWELNKDQKREVYNEVIMKLYDFVQGDPRLSYPRVDECGVEKNLVTHTDPATGNNVDDVVKDDPSSAFQALCEMRLVYQVYHSAMREYEQTSTH